MSDEFVDMTIREFIEMSDDELTELSNQALTACIETNAAQADKVSDLEGHIAYMEDNAKDQARIIAAMKADLLACWTWLATITAPAFGILMAERQAILLPKSPPFAGYINNGQRIKTLLGGIVDCVEHVPHTIYKVLYLLEEDTDNPEILAFQKRLQAVLDKQVAKN